MPAGVRSGNLLEGKGRGQARGANSQIFISPEAELLQVRKTGERTQNNHQEEKLPTRPRKDKREDEGQSSWDGQGTVERICVPDNIDPLR